MPVKADGRVRLRIFTYLLRNGLPVNNANRVASKLVGAMVGDGELHQEAIELAAAAISKEPVGEKTAFGLLEPKAEPFEAWPARSAGSGLSAGGKTMRGRFGGSGLPRIQGRLKSKTPGNTFTKRRTARSAGSGTDFAIIEPITHRREIQDMMGTSLTMNQVQNAAIHVDQMMPLL